MFERICSPKFGSKAIKTFTQPLKLNECVDLYIGVAPTQKIVKINETLTMEEDNAERWSEVDNMMKSVYPIHLQANTPGSGKTYMIEEWIKRTKQVETTLMVCPWNALCSDMRKRNFNAITLHELCGKIGNGKEGETEGKKNAYCMDGITHVHFDEICLYEPSKFNWIEKWINQQKRDDRKMTRSSTGDPNQLAAIG